MRATHLLVCGLAWSLLIGGCDGGPGSNKNDGVVPADDALTGFLVDSAVSGITYTTPTQQGVTGLEGDFHYRKGETVRFTIGDTLLGEVIGPGQVTPFDLAGSAVITGTSELTPERLA